MNRFSTALLLLLASLTLAAEPSKMMSPKLTLTSQPLPTILTGTAAADC